jgi:hypothetical protein
MKLKLKGVFDMAEQLSAAGFYRNVGICYRQRGDGDAATFTKKEKKRRFDEQYFKGVGTGASLGSIIPGVGTAIGAG